MFKTCNLLTSFDTLTFKDSIEFKIKIIFNTQLSLTFLTNIEKYEQLSIVQICVILKFKLSSFVIFSLIIKNYRN